MLQITYTVENKSESKITLFVPGYITDTFLSIYSQKRDTFLIIKPNEKLIVGVGNKIGFPWCSKNIYHNQPGKCGIKRVYIDTMIEMGCSKTEWKYKRRNTNMILSSSHKAVSK